MENTEIEAIQNSAYLPELLGKPLSHIFIYGHNTKAFFASLTSVFRYLKVVDLVKPFSPKKKISNFVSAHELLDRGLSLLTYDGTSFRTDTGITVWAIPVLLLPYRFLLHVGYSIRGVSAELQQNFFFHQLSYSCEFSAEGGKLSQNSKCNAGLDER